MTLTRRHFIGGVMPMWLAGRPALAADSAISAAVLAITHAQPRSLDALLIKSEEGELALTALRGRIVILNMWATWCLPCRREMPSLSRLKVKLQNAPVDILPVAFDRRGLEAVRGFYAETGIANLPALSGDAANLQEVAPNVGLPSTYILDGDGRLRWSVTGEAQWDDEDTLRWITALPTD